MSAMDERAIGWLLDYGSDTVVTERLATRLGRWTGRRSTLAASLANGIAELMDLGELRPGDRLPPERSLASAISVSRGTVVAAYAQLADTGAVDRRQGSGTRVAGAVATFASRSHTDRSDTLTTTHPSSIDLRLGVPEPSARAIEIMQESDWITRLTRQGSNDPTGVSELRGQIADLMTVEGTLTTAEQILVTNGGQHGVSLVIGETVSPGDIVLTEDLTWPGLSDGIVSRGGTVHGLPLGPDGMDVDALEIAIGRLRPSLIALNPHHHNPTGTRMPEASRLRVAELAAQYGVPLLEDRVISPVSFDGYVPPSLASLRPDAPIITVEAISKWGWAGLRAGWVRANPVMVRRIRSTRQMSDWSTSLPAQLLAQDLLTEASQLRRAVSATAEKRMHILEEMIAEHVPEWTYLRPRGGTSLWMRLPGGSATALARGATQHGVSVVGTSAFAVSPSHPDTHVRLPFTSPEADIREGVRRLGDAWREYRELI